MKKKNSNGETSIIDWTLQSKQQPLKKGKCPIL